MEGEKKIILERICQDNQISLLYLLGSKQLEASKILAGEKVEINDPLTDIDVGIVFSFPIEKLKQRYILYARIYNQLSELFSPYQLDLVFLQENHSVFQGEAIAGICAYAESEEIRNAYEEMILRRAADFKYVLDKYYQERLED